MDSATWAILLTTGYQTKGENCRRGTPSKRANHDYKVWQTQRKKEMQKERKKRREEAQAQGYIFMQEEFEIQNKQRQDMG